MSDWICHACKNTVSGNNARECDTCGKLLCDRCREGDTVCKNSKNGTAGCGGRFIEKKP